MGVATNSTQRPAEAVSEARVYIYSHTHSLKKKRKKRRKGTPTQHTQHLLGVVS